jgi:uncharacterized membrane-anchored protein
LAAKVPEITAIFWILKVLTTGMGESMSDYLGSVGGPIGGPVGVVGLSVALRLQFRTREYRAPAYWFAVMMVAVFGTIVADSVHNVASAPYTVTTLLYALAAGVVFLLWWRREGTLSIHSITTRRRESYYWGAVLATFALGTAAGDLTASTFHLGFLISGVVFAAAIAVPAFGWWRFNLSSTAAFWSAYVITRPLGASFADWIGKPRHAPASMSGLGLGDGTVSASALVVFIVLVGYVALAKPDVQREPAAAQRPHGGRARVDPAVETGL